MSWAFLVVRGEPLFAAQQPQDFAPGGENCYDKMISVMQGGWTMNVYDQAHALARNLRNHPDVVALREAKAKVDADPEAKRMLDNFLQQSLELQKKELSGEVASQEEKERLEKLAEIVFLHSDIRAFHEQSLRVERLLHDIYGIITRAVQPDTD